jgi:hypothetical protein
MIGEECRFPCPYCGSEFHFTASEFRDSALCAKCGKELTMPLGRLSPDRGDVFGISRGCYQGDDLDRCIRIRATAAIRQWEEVTARQSSSPEERRAAMLAVHWALFPLHGKAFILDGKRYKSISTARRFEIRVAPVVKKKKRD